MKKTLYEALAALLLATLWLAAFDIANILPLFKTYSSLWFLPSGITLAVVMVAPGWIKLVPLLAGLSLAHPAVVSLFVDQPDPDYSHYLINAVRLYAIYGLAGCILTKLIRIALPFRSWRDVQAFIAVTLIASLLAASTGMAIHIAANRLTLSEGLALAHAWWVSQALGAIMIPPILVPLLMLGFRQDLGEWQWPRPAYWLLQAALIALVIGVGFAGLSLGSAMWYLVIPVVLVSALYGGFEKAASAILLVGVITPVLGGMFASNLPVSELTLPILTAAVAALLIGAATTERRRTNERLAALVARRTQELEKAYEMQRHLVRSLGHDLRQPVEAINLTVEGLSARISDPGAIKGLERARDLGAAASSLLTRILFYARLDVGDVDVHRAHFAIGTLMDQLRALYDPIARRKGVELVWDYPDAELFSDRDLLFQVLGNHLDNAIRLSAKGDQVGVLVTEEAKGTGLFVTDTIAAGTPAPAGAAGLGLRIVAQVAELLEAENIVMPNRRGIIIPYLQRGS